MAHEGTEGRENTVDLDYVVTFNAVAAIEQVQGKAYAFRNSATGRLSDE